MEENKVKMEINKQEAKPKEKVREYTKEELQNMCHQLSEQNRLLYTKNQQLNKIIEDSNLSNFFKRLDYLWSIIHSNSSYLTDSFMKKCAEEFMKMMESPEDKKEE